MRRRQLLTVSVLSPFAAMLASGGPARAAAAAQTFGFSADGSNFLLDGRPFQIRSGEMHPARIPVQYWRHRIQMARAMGLNTIAIYVMWNHVEERPGVFDFTTDRRDIAGFVRLCQAEGMYVLLRPGPYVCAEWDLGGLPPYLLRNPNIRLRVRTAADPHYMAAVARYVNALAAQVRPLMVADGGPILMVQVENEYGSYGTDVTYLEELRRLWLDAGIAGPFYTEDGLGYVQANRTVVAGGAIALSGGDAAAIAAARRSFPAVPAMSGELYSGWLTHWGDGGFAGSNTDISSQLQGLMAGNLSFNIYMVHGGTNFGYSAGANAADNGSGYQPDITSYDYGAPITEQGRPARLYPTYREIIGTALGAPLPAVPAPIPTIVRTGGQAVLPAPYASLWDNLPAALPPAQTVNPQPMEMYGQNSGFILYRRVLPGYTGGRLEVRSVRDYATVFLDGVYQGGMSRSNLAPSYTGPLGVTVQDAPLPLKTSASGSPTLDILVEGMGRTNYGQALVDRKGILERVSLLDAGALTGTLTGWQTHLLPVDEAFVAGLRPVVGDSSRPGIFFKATVNLTQTGDTYLDMSRWTKGVVWVNGRNLGRYWKVGPQQRLYCPAPWLRVGANEIVVFDLHQVQAQPIPFEATLSGQAGATRHSVVNRASGKALDVPGWSRDTGVQLIQWSPNGGANQVWLMAGAAGGVTTMTSVHSQLLADVEGASTADGARVIQWTAHGGGNQQWRVVAVSTDFVKLVNVRSGRVLGVADRATTDGAAVVQQSDTGDPSQHWRLTPA
ncbi:beta-galactosidase [Micromonospora citrea]|uniref:Beta-galactosidase n=1 Tax=Micromonospora citrea TaxID=47855 RepID=A0A1C6VXP8_9ACTN|nr:beta-galactosidase [Micromonospora citrea]SCL71088.1 beta-galactosidase [Micromonospora citrea]